MEAMLVVMVRIMQDRLLEATTSPLCLVWASRLNVAWLLAAVASALTAGLLRWAVTRKVTDFAAWRMLAGVSPPDRGSFDSQL